ncbi:MAG: hypothetical protein GQ574_07110 [Crocinitomix sp.]|nr:hypothetical protein [Crocinitomix sp.]
MKKSYTLIDPSKKKDWSIQMHDRLITCTSGKRIAEKEFEKEMLASKDFFKKVQAKFNQGFIYEDADAEFGEAKLIFRFGNKYSGFYGQDYNEASGILAISWPKTQKGEYYKVQLNPFEVLLQKDWLSFDLFKLQWANKNQLVGIYSGKITLIDGDDPNNVELLTIGDYKAETNFELQYPVLVANSGTDLVAQTIDDKKEFFSIPLHMGSDQKPLFSLHANKEVLAIAKPEGMVVLMNITANELMLSIDTGFEFITKVHVLSKRDEIVVQGGPDSPGTKFYDMKDGKEIFKKFDLSFKYHSGAIFKANGIGTYAVSNNGKYFAAGCGYIDNSQILIFDYESCELVKTIEVDFVNKGFQLFFSKSDSLLFVRTDEGFVIVINFTE